MSQIAWIQNTLQVTYMFYRFYTVSFSSVYFAYKETKKTKLGSELFLV